MMRRIKIFFPSILLVFIFIFTGCRENTPMGRSDYITLSKTELEFDSNGGFQTLSISSSGDWEVLGASDWCRIVSTGNNSLKTIQIIVESNINKENRTNIITFTCGSASVQLTIVQYGVIESDYIDLNLEEEGIDFVYNEDNGELNVNYGEKDVPTISAGKVIVLPADYQHDIRVIEGFNISDKKVTLRTKRGNMCDLFRNIDFTLTTNTDIVKSSRSVGRVITPASIQLVDEDKRYTIYECPSIIARNTFTDKCNFFSMNKDYAGQTLCEGRWGTLEWEKCSYNSSLDAVFFFDFGEASWLDVLKGDLKAFKFYLDGNINADFLLAYLTQTSYSSQMQEIIKKNILPTVEIKFVIGNVPIFITLNTHLGQRATIDCEAGVKVNTGLGFRAKAHVGLEYNRIDNLISPVNSFDVHYEIYKPTFNAQSSAEVSASFFPELEIELYNFLGPRIDIIPYVGNKLEVGTQFGMQGKYGSWTSEIFSGLDAEVGLEIDWFSSLADFVETVEVKGDKVTLYKAPVEIELKYPQNGSMVEIGEEVEVEFQTFAKNYLTDERCNVSNAVIILETDGEVKDKIVKTDESGCVKIRWRARIDQDKLIAKIVDKAGETIDKAEFIPTIRSNMSVSLKEAKGELGGNVTFILEAKGELPENLPQSSEYGVYVLKGGEYTLFPPTAMDGNSFIADFHVKESAENMNVDYQVFKALIDIQVGIYIKDNVEGRIHYSSEQLLKLEYNQKPCVTFESVQSFSIEPVEDDYVKQTYSICFNVEGAFFMRDFYWKDSSGEIPYKEMVDGSQNVWFPIVYQPERPGYDHIRYKAVTNNNQIIYSENCIYWQNASLFIK